MVVGLHNRFAGQAKLSKFSGLFFRLTAAFLTGFYRSLAAQEERRVNQATASKTLVESESYFRSSFRYITLLHAQQG
jgi:hypothetical protein